MPLKAWKSPESQTAFAPKWVVPLFFESFAAPDINQELKELVLDKEPGLMRDIESRPISGIQDGLTSRWHGFNIFSWNESCITVFRDFVKQAYLDYIAATGVPRRRCFIQGWANTIHKGEKLTPHVHDQGPTSYVSGNYCVTSKGSSTIYYPPYFYDGAMRQRTRMRIENRPGMLILFPSALFHDTTPYGHDDVRISLAFDISIQDHDALGTPGMKGRHVLFDDGA